MKYKLKTYTSCLLCILVLFSCTRRPKGVISRQEMEETLYDVYLAQALIQANSRYVSPESRDSLLAGVLAKHQITQAELDSSVVWYSAQGEDYFKINDRVSKRLRDLQSELTIDESMSLKLRKPYDGFTLPPSVMLGKRGCPSAFGFEIDSLKFSQIDTAAFDFNFKTLGITSGAKAYASVRFEYKDTTVSIRTALNRNAYYSFQKPRISKHKLKKITGYIYAENPQKVLPPVYVYDLHYKKTLPKPKPMPIDGKKGRGAITKPRVTG